MLVQVTRCRLTMDVEGFKFFLAAGLKELVRVVFLIVTSLFVMFYYSIPLALLTMAVMPFLIVVVKRFDQRVHPAFRSVRKSLGNLNTRIQENVSGMNTVKSLSKEDFEINRFTVDNKKYREVNIETAGIWARYFPLMELIGNIAMVSLLIFGGWLVIEGKLQLGELVAFFSLVSYIIGPLMFLGFIVNQFSQAKASGERLLEILEQEETVTDQEDTVEVDKLEGHVEFKDVTLRYYEDDDEALKNLNFEVPAGKIVGLIGATGSGKTSITQLLARFISLRRCCLFRWKTDYSYPLSFIRSKLVRIPRGFLFSTTIKDNIAFSNPCNDGRIIEAAKRAQHTILSWKYLEVMIRCLET